MGKIEDSLAAIQSLEDSTERAMMLGGLVSSLFKIKGIVPVMVGQLAYDCYVGDTNTGQDLILCTHSGTLSPRLLQEVLGEQLEGEGMIWKWYVIGVRIEMRGDFYSAHKELCRDFQTDYGTVKLQPLEEMVADRVLASIYPRINEMAKDEAKRLMALGLVNVYDINWQVLQTLCNSNDYRIGEHLATLRAEAKQDVDAALEAQAQSQSASADTQPLPDAEAETIPLPEMPAQASGEPQPDMPDPASDT